MTIFKKIIDKQIPADIVYEDEHCLAFKDINPQSPVHVLLIPKKEIKSLADVEPEDQQLLGHMLLVIRQLAEKFSLTGGFRLVANSGPDGGQTVDHLHFHLLGDRPLQWPPG